MPGCNTQCFASFRMHKSAVSVYLCFFCAVYQQIYSFWIQKSKIGLRYDIHFLFLKHNVKYRDLSVKTGNASFSTNLAAVLKSRQSYKFSVANLIDEHLFHGFLFVVLIFFKTVASVKQVCYVSSKFESL